MAAAISAAAPRALVDVTAEVREACQLAQPKGDGRVEIEVSCQPLPPIRAYPGWVCLLVLNLVLNALDSIAEDSTGRVRVSTCNAAGVALISVADSGAGIPSGVRKRIFEPFFTTKSALEGTGLGLVVVQEIATSLGGSIEVTSAEGQGSRFDVRLPFEVVA